MQNLRLREQFSDRAGHTGEPVGHRMFRQWRKCSLKAWSEQRKLYHSYHGVKLGGLFLFDCGIQFRFANDS